LELIDIVLFIATGIIGMVILLVLVGVVSTLFYSLGVLMIKHHMPDPPMDSRIRWLNKWFIPVKRKIIILGGLQLSFALLSYFLIILDAWYQQGILMRLAVFILFLSLILCQLAFIFFLLNMKAWRWKSIIPFILLAFIFYISFEIHPYKLRNILIKKRLETSLPQFQATVNDIQSGKLKPGEDERYQLPASVPALFALKQYKEGEPVRIIFFTGNSGLGSFNSWGYIYVASSEEPTDMKKILPHWYWYIN
jgi:hypothetical protein